MFTCKAINKHKQNYMYHSICIMIGKMPPPSPFKMLPSLSNIHNVTILYCCLLWVQVRIEPQCPLSVVQGN